MRHTPFFRFFCQQFDTKLPQFGTSEDLEDFLRAPLIQKLYPQMLGGPFYTSVPCGRVGMGKDSAFISNEVFVEAVKKVEKYDHARIEARLGSVGAAPLIQRVGKCLRRVTAMDRPCPVAVPHGKAYTRGWPCAKHESFSLLSNPPPPQV
jgi:hypothetical protein